MYLFLPIEASTCFKLAASPLMNANNPKSTVILKVLKIAYFHEHYVNISGSRWTSLVWWTEQGTWADCIKLSTSDQRAITWAYDNNLDM